MFTQNGKVDFIYFAVFLFALNCEIFKTVFQNGPIDSYWCKKFSKQNLKIRLPNTRFRML